MAVTATAQAVPPSQSGQPAKVQPTATVSDNATHHGNSAGNHTTTTHVPPGQLKLGKITAPPIVTLHNQTATVNANKSTVADNARLTLAKKTASLKIGLVIRQLEQYQRQIARSSLGADEKAAIIAIAENNIAWYRQQDSNIQAAGDLETINELSDEANRQTDLLKVNMKKEAGIMACEQLDERIATARNVPAIAAGMISRLNASASDVAAMENCLNNYGAHIDAAGGYAGAARAAFEGISSESNADSGFNAGYQQIRMADQEMEKAYDDLKGFYRLYLGNGHNK